MKPEWQDMAARLDTPQGRELYSKRAGTIESVFAQLTNRLGRTLNHRPAGRQPPDIPAHPQPGRQPEETSHRQHGRAPACPETTRQQPQHPNTRQNTTTRRKPAPLSARIARIRDPDQSRATAS
jgi:hypothetical protein